MAVNKKHERGLQTLYFFEDYSLMIWIVVLIRYTWLEEKVVCHHCELDTRSPDFDAVHDAASRVAARRCCLIYRPVSLRHQQSRELGFAHHTVHNDVVISAPNNKHRFILSTR